METQTLETLELEPHTAGLIDRRYVVREVLSADEHRAVLTAYDEVDHELVALKVVRLSSGRSFVELLTEYEALSEIDHPRVLRAHRLIPVNRASHAMVVDLIDGKTLHTCVEDDGAMPVWRVGDILCQLCDGLRAVHAAGWVHADLKPSNIMYDGDCVTLIDFGVARQIGKRSSAFSGTPDFASPEHIRGEPLDPRSDIYSLGATAFTLLTGRVPPHSAAGETLTLTSCTGTPFPPEVEEIIATLMASDPDDRPQSMQEVRVLLRSLDMQTLAFESTADADLEEAPTVRTAASREYKPTPLNLQLHASDPTSLKLLGSSHARGLTTATTHPQGAVYALHGRTLVFVDGSGPPRHVAPLRHGDARRIALGPHADIHVLTTGGDILVCDEDLDLISQVAVPGAAELSAGDGVGVVLLDDGKVRLTRNHYEDVWDELDEAASCIAASPNGEWFAFGRGVSVHIFRLHPRSYEESQRIVFPADVSCLAVSDDGRAIVGLETGAVCAADGDETVVKGVVPNLISVGCYAGVIRALGRSRDDLHHFEIEMS